MSASARGDLAAPLLRVDANLRVTDDDELRQRIDTSHVMEELHRQQYDAFVAGLPPAVSMAQLFDQYVAVWKKAQELKIASVVPKDIRKACVNRYVEHFLRTGRAKTIEFDAIKLESITLQNNNNRKLPTEARDPRLVLTDAASVQRARAAANVESKNAAEAPTRSDDFLLSLDRVGAHDHRFFVFRRQREFDDLLQRNRARLPPTVLQRLASGSREAAFDDVLATGHLNKHVHLASFFIRGGVLPCLMCDRGFDAQLFANCKPFAAPTCGWIEVIDLSVATINITSGTGSRRTARCVRNLAYLFRSIQASDKAMGKLREIHLVGCQLAVADFEALCSMLPGCTGLEVLNLAEVSVETRGNFRLADSLPVPAAYLRCVDISDLRVNGEHARESELLALVHSVLRSCRESNGSCALAAFYCDNHSKKGSCHSKAAAAFLDLLRLPSFMSFSCCGHRVPNDSAALIANTVKTSHQLLFCDLRDNAVGTEGSTTIYEPRCCLAEAIFGKTYHTQVFTLTDAPSETVMQSIATATTAHRELLRQAPVVSVVTDMFLHHIETEQGADADRMRLCEKKQAIATRAKEYVDAVVHRLRQDHIAATCACAEACCRDVLATTEDDIISLIRRAFYRPLSGIAMKEVRQAAVRTDIIFRSNEAAVTQGQLRRDHAVAYQHAYAPVSSALTISGQTAAPPASSPIVVTVNTTATGTASPVQMSSAPSASPPRTDISGAVANPLANMPPAASRTEAASTRSDSPCQGPVLDHHHAAAWVRDQHLQSLSTVPSSSPSPPRRSGDGSATGVEPHGSSPDPLNSTIITGAAPNRNPLVGANAPHRPPSPSPEGTGRMVSAHHSAALPPHREDASPPSRPSTPTEYSCRTTAPTRPLAPPPRPPPPPAKISNVFQNLWD